MPVDFPIRSIAVRGLGAVSPAGWSAPSLVREVNAGNPVPHEEIPSSGVASDPVLLRRVPEPTERPVFFCHPRLRRVSPITRFIVSAGLEALGEERAATVRAGELRLGIVVVLSTGCVDFTRRFYEEILAGPALASPILFPETVFNAPASHLAAVLGSTGINYTLLGDSAQFLSGVRTALDWLATDQCDGCLVVGAEESDWLIHEAVRLFEPDIIFAEGAGALYLEKAGSGDSAIRLVDVTEAFSYTNRLEKCGAAHRMRRALQVDGDMERHGILFDGLRGLRKGDAAETAAWENWTGSRLSVRKILGEALGASVAWQCVTAVSRLQEQAGGASRMAAVSAVGDNQQAIGVLFGSSRLVDSGE